MDETPTLLSREGLMKRAWERWFNTDYSWDGLKESEWTDELTLQDYWLDGRSEDDLRANGELIEVAGQKTYHIAHLPLHYRDGTPTRKTSHRDEVQAQLDALILARLNHAVTQSEDAQEIEAKKALFFGMVFLDLDLSQDAFENPLNALFAYCIVSGQANFIVPPSRVRPISTTPPSLAMPIS
jgi:hypothetical protein